MPSASDILKKSQGKSEIIFLNLLRKTNNEVLEANTQDIKNRKYLREPFPRQEMRPIKIVFAEETGWGPINDLGCLHKYTSVLTASAGRRFFFIHWTPRREPVVCTGCIWLICVSVNCRFSKRHHLQDSQNPSVQQETCLSALFFHCRHLLKVR